MSKDKFFSLENAGKSPSTSVIIKEEVTIDNEELENLLQQTLATTKDCTVELLTELYVRLDKKISLFKDEWDRTSLPQVCIVAKVMLESVLKS